MELQMHLSLNIAKEAMRKKNDTLTLELLILFCINIPSYLSIYIRIKWIYFYNTFQNI